MSKKNTLVYLDVSIIGDPVERMVFEVLLFFSGSTEWFDTATGIESDGDEDFYSTQDGKKFLKKK